MTPGDAASDFLTALLAAAGEGRDWTDAEVAFTVPVDSFEDYREWMAGVAEQAGFARPRFIDAASAARRSATEWPCRTATSTSCSTSGAARWIYHPPGRVRQADAGEMPSRRCHVLGKASADLGGITIDQWLLEDVLAQRPHQRRRRGPPAGQGLLVDCERCKEQLSKSEKADVSVLNAETGVILSADYTREQFEQLLESHGLYARIDQVIGLALDERRTHGCEPEHIIAALMVGGSSLIPSVKDRLTAVFGEERVRYDRPLDAPARGCRGFRGRR